MTDSRHEMTTSASPAPGQPALRAFDVDIARQIGRYSDAVMIPAGFDVLHVSGTPGLRQDGHLPTDIAGQADLAWRNVSAALSAADMKITDIVKVTQSLIDEADLPEYVKVRSRHLADHRPASMLAIVPALVWPDIRVEIEVIAAAPPGPDRKRSA
jgi:2-iminobutanoate/2-iminopropanoate deaminase